MKKYVLLSILLMAGLAAFPQATRTSRESSSKSNTERSSQRSVSSSSRSAQESKKSSGTVSRSAAQKSSGTVSRSAEQKSSGAVSRSAAERSVGTVNRSAERKSTGQVNRSESVKDRGQVNRSSAVKSEGTVRRSVEPERRGTVTRTVAERDAGRNAISRETTQTTRGGSSSATRTMREERSTLVMDDGRRISHDNDRVFASRRHDLNYRDYHELRRSRDFIRVYNDYNHWRNRRVIRVVHHNHYYYTPLALEVRRIRYPYPHPVHVNLIWTPTLLHRFMFYYPHWEQWRYDFGRHIEDVSAYDAMEYAGSVKRVYGKVHEVYYSPEDQNYILYIGAPFPYHDMTVVIPRHIAKQISASPKWYFSEEHVWVIGLIEMWEGKPEIVVHDSDQIRRY